MYGPSNGVRRGLAGVFVAEQSLFLCYSSRLRQEEHKRRKVISLLWVFFFLLWVSLLGLVILMMQGTAKFISFRLIIWLDVVWMSSSGTLPFTLTARR